MQRQIHRAKAYGGQPDAKKATNRIERRKEESVEERKEALALYWTPPAGVVVAGVEELPEGERLITLKDFGGMDELMPIWDEACTELEEAVNSLLGLDRDITVFRTAVAGALGGFRSTVMISRHAQIEAAKKLVKEFVEAKKFHLLVDANGMRMFDYSVEGRSRATRSGWALNIELAWKN